MAAPLPMKRMMDAHYVHRTLFARVESGTTLADVLEPHFWSFCVTGVRIHDKIEVLSDDNKLDCELRVLDVLKSSLLVKLIRAPIEQPKSLKAPEDDGKSLPRTEFCPGGGHKWRVLDSHGEVYAKGYATEEEAEVKLAEYRQLHGLKAAA